jgi:hypothetical protein
MVLAGRDHVGARSGKLMEVTQEFGIADLDRQISLEGGVLVYHKRLDDAVQARVQEIRVVSRIEL